MWWKSGIVHTFICCWCVFIFAAKKYTISGSFVFPLFVAEACLTLEILKGSVWFTGRKPWALVVVFPHFTTLTQYCLYSRHQVINAPVDISVCVCIFSSHVSLFWSAPPELSVQSMLSVRCTRQQDALTTTTTMWSSWSMWSYVLQSRTLAVGTCQSTWPHPQGPSLSCSPTGKKKKKKTRWELLPACECKTEFISDVLTHWVQYLQKLNFIKLLQQRFLILADILILPNTSKCCNLQRIGYWMECKRCMYLVSIHLT